MTLKATIITGELRQLPSKTVIPSVKLKVKGSHAEFMLSERDIACLWPELVKALDSIAESHGIESVKVEGETYYFHPVSAEEVS